MTGEKKTPTHFRLLTTLRAIGPYLREVQSSEGAYLFDCLSVCVNDKKSPENAHYVAPTRNRTPVCHSVEGTNVIDVRSRAMDAGWAEYSGI